MRICESVFSNLEFFLVNLLENNLLDFWENFLTCVRSGVIGFRHGCKDDLNQVSEGVLFQVVLNRYSCDNYDVSHGYTCLFHFNFTLAWNFFHEIWCLFHLNLLEISHYFLCGLIKHFRGYNTGSFFEMCSWSMFTGGKTMWISS